MSRGATPWVDSGSGLRARFAVDPTGSKRTTTLVKETNQPDRNIIMRHVAEKRKEADAGGVKDMSFGRYVGEIPLIDFLRIQKTHPDLFSPDVEIARKATIKFFNSTEGAPYRVKKA